MLTSRKRLKEKSCVWILIPAFRCDPWSKLRPGLHLCFLHSPEPCCRYLHINYHSRPVVPGCAGYALAHPDFGRSVNPISTRGTDYAHLITTGTTGFSDLPTALTIDNFVVFWFKWLDLKGLLMSLCVSNRLSEVIWSHKWSHKQTKRQKFKIMNQNLFIQ